MFARFSEVVVSFLETKEGFFLFSLFLATAAGNTLTLSKNCHLLLGDGAGKEPCLPSPRPRPERAHQLLQRSWEAGAERVRGRCGLGSGQAHQPGPRARMEATVEKTVCIGLIFPGVCLNEFINKNIGPCFLRIGVCV